MLNSEYRQSMIDNYFRSRSNKYSRKFEKGFLRFLRQSETKAVVKALSPIEKCKILDVGCGDGWHIKYLRSHIPGVYLAIDRLPSMLANIHLSGIFTAAGDAIHLPTNLLFDRILCAGVLEFIKEPGAFLKEASRVLNGKGKIIVLLPSRSLFARIYRLYFRAYGCKVDLFSENKIRFLASENGLRVIAIKRVMRLSIIATIEKSP